ncbi:uncharacterized protein LOC135963855 [Calliphora vicina]|uniref:uncharacterized protein LOC135963855 n=1 Tax=Calliphora vicina TaxID=7373 RepID=UPI00325AF523
MIADDGAEAIEDDIDNNELLHEVYENVQDSDFTRLTEMVRKHYLNYLEKQLEENLLNSNYTNKKNGIHKEDYDNELCKKSIKKTAELLEDKAVKACMIAKFYQRAMVKIIAIVRRTTQEKRLLTHLEKCIQTKDECKPVISSKETQTEAGLLVDETIDRNPIVDNEHDKNIMSLDEKIEMFQKHLQKEKCIDIVKKYPLNNYTHKMSKRQHKHHHEHQNYRGHNRHRGEQRSKHKPEVDFSPASSVVTAPNSPTSPIIKQTTTPTTLLDSSIVGCSAVTVVENENSNDSIGAELARLFSEEKTELDEIFGIDPNDEPDDPQICKILKEIEDAKINPTNEESKPSTCTQSNMENLEPETCNSFLEPKQEQLKQPCSDLSLTIDLSKSIWPCELFMQRRKLSESLARLIDEDMRWHDVMKWKFSLLFGEDSDDEFTPCSPSIELDEVLIGSCIRRISPWVVKHLMKPMRDGLIGNRFLFKKLAKNLARSIIMENQYPDESIIKDCVENFFCLHQAVMSLEDLEVDMPSISYF